MIEKCSAAIIYQADATLTPAQDHAVRHLLRASFPYETAFLSSRFIKAAPAHRWLLWNDAGDELIAHAAAHEKTIGSPAGELRIGGVCEVCVASDHRGQGLLKTLLEALHQRLREESVPFAMLFGQPRVYLSSGYTVITNDLRADNALARHWNPFCGKPMVRALSCQPWPEGQIDLRGPTF